MSDKDWRKDVDGTEITPYLVRYIAKENFENGDPRALDRCVLACHEDGEPIPDWAVEELAKRARISLGIDVPPPNEGGRHTNPIVEYREKREREEVCSAVHAARRLGIPKEKSYDKAKEVLAVASKHHKERGSIKTIFSKHGRDYSASPMVEQYESALELMEEDRFDEFCNEYKIDKNQKII
jgi:hypothetical protein